MSIHHESRLHTPSFYKCFLFITFLLAAACQGGSRGGDSGSPSGRADAGDAGRRDSEPMGSAEAGDAGELDAGPRDSGPEASQPPAEPPDASRVECPEATWPESADAGEPNKPYSVSIQRRYATDFEAELIAEAENLAPSPEIIRSYAISKDDYDADRCTPDSAEESSSAYYESLRLWCNNLLACVCFPYAIMCHTVAHYRNRTLAFRRKDFTPSGGTAIERSSLSYSAVVYFYDSFEHEGEVFTNVYVVQLNLTWVEYCGNVCAYGFTKERFVVFDAEGRVQAVLGDGGEISMIIS